MSSYKSELDEILDRLNHRTNSIFDEYVAVNQMYNIGRISIDQIQDWVTISPKVGAGVELEPIPMLEIKEFKNRYPEFISSVFHGLLVQTWTDCLSEIFSLFIDLSINNLEKFERFKNIDFTIKLDFRQSDINTQIKEGLVKGFNFKDYSKKYTLINNVLDPGNTAQTALQDIFINIQLRNCIQHNQGCIDSYTLKKLGLTEIRILDDTGTSKTHKEGDKFIITLPQIFSFKRSILTVIQIWRSNA